MPRKQVMGVASDIPVQDTGLQIGNEDLTIHNRIAEANQLSQLSPVTSFSEAAGVALRRDNVLGALFHRGSGGFATPNPDFVFTPELLKEYSDVKDEFKPELLKARSREELDLIANQIRQGQEDDEKMARAGGTGIALSMGAALLDPANWVLDGAVAPLAALGKASRLKRIASAGAAAGASNMASEVMLNDLSQGRQSDVVTAGAIGLILGGSIGGLLKPRELEHLDRAAGGVTRDLDVKTLNDAGVPTLPVEHINKGKEVSLDQMRDWYANRIEGMNETERAMHLGRIQKAADEGRMSAHIDDLVDEQLAKLDSEQVDAPDILKTLKDTTPENAAMREAFNKAVGERYIKNTPKTFEERMAAIREAADEVRMAERKKLWDDLQKKEEARKQREMDKLWEEAKMNPVDLPTKAPAEAPVASKMDEGTKPFSIGDAIEGIKKDGTQVSGTVSKVSADGSSVVIKDADGKVHKLTKDQIDAHMPYDSPSTGFVHGSVGSAQVAHIAHDAPHGVNIPWFGKKTLRIPLRFDWFAKLISTENLAAHRLIKDLIVDPVKGGWNNASELAEAARGVFRSGFYIPYQQQFDKWAMRNNVPWYQRMQKSTEFAELVTAAVRGVESALAHPEVATMAKHVAETHRKILAEAKRVGVEGADEIMPDPSYMMRRFNQTKIRLLTQKFGEEEIGGVIGRAIQRARPDIDPAKAMKIGLKYFQAVRSLAYRTDMAFGRDMSMKEQALIRQSLKEIGTDPGDIEAVMDIVMSRSTRTEGDHARLKDRVSLDETYAEQLKTVDGNTEVFALQDLFENDSRVLMDIYSKQMSGLIGFAKVGIKSESDWTRRINEITEYAQLHGLDPAAHQALVGDLEKIRSFILGRPMDANPYGNLERVSRVLRDINFFRMMGQVGFAQVAEFGNVIGLAGTRAALMHISSYSDLVKQAKKGLIDDDLARDLLNIGGFGSEAAGNHALYQVIEDGVEDAAMSAVERAANVAKHTTAEVSGLIAINNVLRQFAARAFTQKFVDFANGVTKLDNAALKKLETAGLHEGNIDGVFNDLKRFSQRDANGKVTRVDFEAWQQANPNSADAFKMAVWREARRAVQEHTIGETSPLMHTQVGKILTQFRGFMLVAYSKQFLYGINHMDMHTASAWMLSMVFGGAAYVAQSALNTAHDSAAMEKKLSPEEIAKASFARAGWSSILPALIDTGLDLTTGDPVFSNSRSSGQAASFIAGNPTVSLMNGLYQTMKGATNEIISGDEHVWTKSQVKTGLGMVVPNWVLVRNVVDAASSGFPKHDPNQFQH